MCVCVCVCVLYLCAGTVLYLYLYALCFITCSPPVTNFSFPLSCLLKKSTASTSLFVVLLDVMTPFIVMKETHCVAHVSDATELCQHVVLLLWLAGQRWDGRGAHREEPGHVGLQERLPVGWVPSHSQTSGDGQLLIWFRCFSVMWNKITLSKTD